MGGKNPQVKQILKLKSFDLLFQSQSKEKSLDIGIVTIDEASIEKWSMVPWDRRVIGDLLVKLEEAQVGVIMMPILFSEPDELGGDEQLAKFITRFFCCHSTSWYITNK